MSAKSLQICLQEGVDVLGHQDDVRTPQLTDEKALWQGPGCAQFDDANPILGFEEVQGFLGISPWSPACNDESLRLLGTQVFIEFRSLEYVAATIKLGPKFAVKGQSRHIDQRPARIEVRSPAQGDWIVEFNATSCVGDPGDAADEAREAELLRELKGKGNHILCLLNGRRL